MSVAADPNTTTNASKAVPADADTRPLLAIIANAVPPYRLHMHRRIAAEIPEIQLATVLTHEVSNAPWALKDSKEIGLISFGRGEDSGHQDAFGRAWHEWRKGGRIIGWLKGRQVGAVLVNGYNDPGRLRIIRWCRRNRITCLLFGDSNIHGDKPRGWRGKVKRILLGRVLKSVNAVLPCGSLGRAYFERYGVAAGDIFYSPYEPDYAAIQNLSPTAMESAAERFGLKSGRRRIIFSGRLVPVKRPELLIQAFARIADQRSEWDLVIVGDGPLRASLRAELPAGLSDRVVWTGFLDDQETVGALYRNCDVLCLPSDYEPWALVVNEAAAAGLAIVASDVVGAAAELVVPGKNGQTFPAGSLSGLVDALNVVTDPTCVDKFKAGSKPVLESWRRSADPIDGIRRALRHVGVLSSVQLAGQPGKSITP
jgi:glycosyltransferase involved in cell wall biosynthesis